MRRRRGKSGEHADERNRPSDHSSREVAQTAQGSITGDGRTGRWAWISHDRQRSVAAVDEMTMSRR
jgi:hypothetical protein